VDSSPNFEVGVSFEHVASCFPRLCTESGMRGDLELFGDDLARFAAYQG